MLLETISAIGIAMLMMKLVIGIGSKILDRAKCHQNIYSTIFNDNKNEDDAGIKIFGVSQDKEDSENEEYKKYRGISTKLSNIREYIKTLKGGYIGGLYDADGNLCVGFNEDGIYTDTYSKNDIKKNDPLVRGDIWLKRI